MFKNIFLHWTIIVKFSFVQSAIILFIFEIIKLLSIISVKYDSPLSSFCSFNEKNLSLRKLLCSMNKIFQIIVGALMTVIVIAFASCQEEDEGEKTPEYTWPSKHYLQRYILPDSLIDPSWDYLSKIKIIFKFIFYFFRNG